eukprot:m.131437 g.131437  ORF g.131437 m.131437 type:complete len:1036 (+) comp13753_c0_seq2:3-3110(+)
MSEEAKAGSARELRSPDLDALLNSSLDTFLPLDSTAAAPPKDSEPAEAPKAPPRTKTAEGGPPQEKAGGKISGAVLATVCQRCNNSLMHLYADSDPSQLDETMDVLITAARESRIPYMILRSLVAMRVELHNDQLAQNDPGLSLAPLVSALRTRGSDVFDPGEVARADGAIPVPLAKYVAWSALGAPTPSSKALIVKQLHSDGLSEHLGAFERFWEEDLCRLVTVEEPPVPQWKRDLARKKRERQAAQSSGDAVPAPGSKSLSGPNGSSGGNADRSQAATPAAAPGPAARPVANRAPASSDHGATSTNGVRPSHNASAPPPPPPPPPSETPEEPAATTVSQTYAPWDTAKPFYTSAEIASGSVQGDGTAKLFFPEGGGNALHLGTVARKYTASKMAVVPGGRYTAISKRILYNALGLFKSLQHDIALYNAAAAPETTAGQRRYLRKRLLQQMNEFGVRVDPSKQPTFESAELNDLVHLIEKENTEILDVSKALIDSGATDFDGLHLLYTPGAAVQDSGLVTGLSGQTMGLLVRGCFYMEGKTLFGQIKRTFHVAFEFVVSVGGALAVVEFEHLIPEIEGVLNLSTLHFAPLLGESGEAARAALDARGRKFVRIACGGHRYAQYTAGSFVPSGGYATQNALSQSHGRVMVDTAAAYDRGVTSAKTNGVGCPAVNAALRQRQNAQVAASSGGGGDAEGHDSQLLYQGDLPDELAWTAWPTLCGFSFTQKCWGHVLVAGLREVEFNLQAFEKLVLPPQQKDLIRALVSHSHKVASTDLIAGKGEGCIFLLHGPPGVGKTLTAEAIAERLQRPLYMISMGELGTTPETLEKRLADIFSLCSPWQALVLIDEAEMLLERRSPGDVVRNSMVCVMLRLLEYYQGVLFLTSNRVSSLDPAFQSRVTCALHYPSLDASARASIWQGLLDDLQRQRPESVGPTVDVNALARYRMNGRQIKTTVRLGMTLAKQHGASLSQEHLIRTAEITADFAEHVQGRLTDEFAAVELVHPASGEGGQWRWALGLVGLASAVALGIHHLGRRL